MVNRSKRSKRKESLILSLYSLFSMLAVSFIKVYLRPKKVFSNDPLFDYLQGTLPNFFAATGICSLIFFYLNMFSGLKRDKCILFAVSFTFIGLSLWEFIQYTMGYPMDLNDILMTALGCILTVIFIKLINGQ